MTADATKESFGDSAQLGDREAQELLEEFELRHGEGVEELRGRFAVRVQARIVVRPADICDRDRVVARDQEEVR